MRTTNPPSTPIACNKTQAMSRVLDLIPRGYSRWVAGQVSAEKAAALAQKFHNKYGIGCTPAQRVTRKKDGKANACLVMFWPDHAKTVEWLLLASQGTGLESESMRRVEAKPRLIWLGYELVRHTTRQRAMWTWKRPAEQMAEWYALLGSVLNPQQMFKVSSVLESIARQPGFHGIREQSWALCQFSRLRGYVGEIPYLYFVQKGVHGEKLILPAEQAGHR